MDPELQQDRGVGVPQGFCGRETVLRNAVSVNPEKLRVGDFKHAME